MFLFLSCWVLDRAGSTGLVGCSWKHPWSTSLHFNQPAPAPALGLLVNDRQILSFLRLFFGLFFALTPMVLVKWHLVFPVLLGLRACLLSFTLFLQLHIQTCLLLRVSRCLPVKTSVALCPVLCLGSLVSSFSKYWISTHLLQFSNYDSVCL